MRWLWMEQEEHYKDSDGSVSRRYLHEDMQSNSHTPTPYPQWPLIIIRLSKHTKARLEPGAPGHIVGLRDEQIVPQFRQVPNHV